MKYYEELSARPCFTTEDVLELTGNYNSAMSVISRLTKTRYAIKIRRGLYTCVNPATYTSDATLFQIASAVTTDSFCSHHTALTYWGLADQVYSDVYVSSASRFSQFEFEGNRYVRVAPSFKDSAGIIVPFMNPNVRVTDKERTVLDCIADMDKISGFEEVYSALQLVHSLSEENLMKYLPLYGSQFIWQKAGFLLTTLQGEADRLVGDDFLMQCKKMMGKSKRYLSSRMKCSVFVPDWNLYVPDTLDLKNGG